MFNYTSEAAFSTALVKHLRNKGWFIQRIESGETGKGIPDIFAISPAKEAMWFELKRIKHRCNEQTETITWRPGQQSWLHEVWLRGMKTYTLCCFNDVILMIPHHVIYYHNEVHPHILPYFTSLKEL